MTLNWTPEVIEDFIAAFLLLICALVSFVYPRKKKIKSLLFISSAVLFSFLFYLIEALSILYLDLILTRIFSLLFIPIVISFVIGINYTMKESIYSIGLIIVIIISSISVYAAFLPNSAIIIRQSGFLTTSAGGMFLITVDLLIFSSFFFLFYWGVKTWVNAPFLIKREAFLFLISTSLLSLFSAIIYALNYLDPFFILVSDLVFSAGVIVLIYVILKEPKLLYILPFEIHRIVVKDRDGSPLFDHDWSESKISDSMFTGFINAVQLMSEEVIHKGGLLDIVLTDGIVIVRESKYITVGLVASKSSKLLRTLIISFATDFEEKFSKLLKISCKNMEEYDGAYELLEKYFSNFPSKLISSKKDALYLIVKYKEIPSELENKLKSIGLDEIDYEKIKEEIKKFPDCVPLHFINFYENNKDVLKFRDEKELSDKTQD